MMSLTNSEEFHSVKNDRYPRKESHFRRSWACVAFPLPSSPSKTIKRPGGRVGARSVAIRNDLEPHRPLELLHRPVEEPRKWGSSPRKNDEEARPATCEGRPL